MEIKYVAMKVKYKVLLKKKKSTWLHTNSVDILPNFCIVVF